MDPEDLVELPAQQGVVRSLDIHPFRGSPRPATSSRGSADRAGSRPGLDGPATEQPLKEVAVFNLAKEGGIAGDRRQPPRLDPLPRSRAVASTASGSSRRVGRPGKDLCRSLVVRQIDRDRGIALPKIIGEGLGPEEPEDGGDHILAHLRPACPQAHLKIDELNSQTQRRLAGRVHRPFAARRAPVRGIENLCAPAWGLGREAVSYRQCPEFPRRAQPGDAPHRRTSGEPWEGVARTSTSSRSCSDRQRPSAYSCR